MRAAHWSKHLSYHSKATRKDYIDIGDGCWRQAMLVACMRFWWPIGGGKKSLWKKALKKVANIFNLSPTSLCHQYHSNDKELKFKINHPLLAMVRNRDLTTRQKCHKKWKKCHRGISSFVWIFRFVTIWIAHWNSF